MLVCSGQESKMRAGKGVEDGEAPSHASSLGEKAERDRERDEISNKMTQLAEASAEGNEFGQVPLICRPQREKDAFSYFTWDEKLSSSFHLLLL